MVLQQVLSVALVLQIDALSVTVDIAAELEKDVTVDNCTSILACADCHHLPQLKQKGQAVAKRAFVAVASDPVLPASSMLVLLQSDNLNVDSEEQVVETLSTWLTGQAEPLIEAEQLEIFGLVRFVLLSQVFINSIVMTDPTFSTLLACKLWLTQFKDFFLAVQSLSSVGLSNHKFFWLVNTTKSSRGWTRVLQRSWSCCFAPQTTSGGLALLFQVQQQGPNCNRHQMYGRLCFWRVYENTLGIDWQYRCMCGCIHFFVTSPWQCRPGQTGSA